ncbi:MAG: hypothetical protein P4L40_17840 [Terracidiphilus sp.]|nr:hypothetical protein [Terracidiphilus sp.]
MSALAMMRQLNQLPNGRRYGCIVQLYAYIAICIEIRTVREAPVMISKTDAAEQQLDTAIRLFFENRDHLSSYALAVASREVTDDVIQSRHSEIYQRELARLGDPQKVRLSYRDEMGLHIKPEFYKEFRTLDRKWQNFLKHADRDPDAEIEPVKPRLLAMVIISAVRNYTLLTRQWTAEMGTFFAWLAIAEPQLIKSEPKDATFDNAIVEMRSCIADDPYGRDTMERIYTAIRLRP